MNRDDFLASGLTLEKPQGSLNNLDNYDFSGWYLGGFSDSVPEEIINLLLKDAQNQNGNRFDSYLMLCLYYMDKKDYKRGKYYAKVALSFATTHAWAADCHWNIFHAEVAMQTEQANCGQVQSGGPDVMAIYDQFVYESMLSILENDANGIVGAMRYCIELGDYGLGAVAAQTWILHPKNTDDYDREMAEARYHQWMKEFKDQKEQGFTETIYARLPNEPDGKTSCRAKVRIEFLFKHSARLPQSFLYAQADERGIQKTETTNLMKEKSDRLIGQVSSFQERYSKHSRSLYSAKPKILQAYISMATDIVEELQRENLYLMRALVNDSAVFEDMQDYLLLGAAATLLYIHPENRDGREKISTQKKSALWMETSISLSEQFHDMQPLEYRLKELNMSERYTYQRKWMELAQYVNEMVSQSA